jgi:hypothetical protein
MVKVLRSAAIILGIAAVHFLVCRLLVTMTMYFNLATAGSDSELPLLTQLVVGITRVLYFPVISLSLYSRQMFPGNWIFVPIFINSLIWGVCGYLVYLAMIKTIFRKNS